MSGGSGSPFIVYDGAGNIMFDARYASLRAWMICSGTLPANSVPEPFPSNPSSPAYTTNSFGSIPYGKTFDLPPMHITFQRTSGGASWTSLQSRWPTSGSGKIQCTVASAKTSEIYYANWFDFSAFDFKSVIFENGARG